MADSTGPVGFTPFEQLFQDIKQTNPRLFDVLSRIHQNLKVLFIILKVSMISTTQIIWQVVTEFTQLVTFDKGLDIKNSQSVFMENINGIMNQTLTKFSDNNIYFDNPDGKVVIRPSTFGGLGSLGVDFYGPLTGISSGNAGGIWLCDHTASAQWKIINDLLGNNILVIEPTGFGITNPCIQLYPISLAPFGAFGGVLIGGDVMYVCTNSTGGGTASLGTNCPAGTLGAPYTWVKELAADGTPCVRPVWKI